MKFTIFVAVDLLGGRVVRLRRGEFEERREFGDDPAAIAADWERRGAEWLHLVDLEAAASGEPMNAEAIEEILRRVKIPCQVSGGIRSIEEIGRWLDRGAARVVVGTKALDEDFVSEAVTRYRDRFVAAVDARRGEVQVAGWREGSGSRSVEAARRLAGAGVSRILFTDIDRDGMLGGPNLEAIEEMLDAVPVPVIASGGVEHAGTVAALAGMASRGLEGVIIGTALYTGALELDDARRAARE